VDPTPIPKKRKLENIDPYLLLVCLGLVYYTAGYTYFLGVSTFLGTSAAF
jgi:hypothetical protein